MFIYKLCKLQEMQKTMLRTEMRLVTQYENDSTNDSSNNLTMKPQQSSNVGNASANSVVEEGSEEHELSLEVGGGNSSAAVVANPSPSPKPTPSPKQQPPPIPQTSVSSRIKETFSLKKIKSQNSVYQSLSKANMVLYKKTVKLTRLTFKLTAIAGFCILTSFLILFLGSFVAEISLLVAVGLLCFFFV